MLDLDTVMAEVKAIAAADPDRRASCHYVLDNRPECIVGQWLFKRGVPVKTIEELHVIRPASNDFSRITGIFMTAPAATWLTLVQARQDGGCTWMDAVDC